MSAELKKLAQDLSEYGKLKNNPSFELGSKLLESFADSLRESELIPHDLAYYKSLANDEENVRDSSNDVFTPEDQVHETNEELADKLSTQGLVFEVIPDGIYPGMPYATVKDITESGITNYSPDHIRSLARNSEVKAFRVGSIPIFDAEGVNQLITRGQEQLDAPALKGRKPGAKSRS